MTNKNATLGEYAISVEADGSIRVSKAVEDVVGTLREIAEAKGMEIPPEWDTRSLGQTIVDTHGDGKTAVTGAHTVVRDATGGIRVLRVCDNAKGALREIAEKAGFDYDPNWNTRQFGGKIIDFINIGKAPGEAEKAAEDIADKLGAEVAEAADKARDAADKLGAEALKVGKQASESGIVRTGVDFLKKRLGIEIEPPGCIITAAVIVLIAIVVAYLLWGGTAVVVAIIILGLIYTAYRFFAPKD